MHATKTSNQDDCKEVKKEDEQQLRGDGQHHRIDSRLEQVHNEQLDHQQHDEITETSLAASPVFELQATDSNLNPKSPKNVTCIVVGDPNNTNTTPTTTTISSEDHDVVRIGLNSGPTVDSRLCPDLDENIANSSRYSYEPCYKQTNLFNYQTRMLNFEGMNMLL